MTIDEIRTKHEGMTLDELQTEIHSRDLSVQGIRAEMREIRHRLEPKILSKQREELRDAIAKGANTVELVPGPMMNLGGK